MSDENEIIIKYLLFMNGIEYGISEEGYLLNNTGGMIFCAKCMAKKNLSWDNDNGKSQLLKLGAYFKEYEKGISVKCQCCGRVEMDEFEKLKRKDLII